MSTEKKDIQEAQPLTEEEVIYFEPPADHWVRLIGEKEWEAKGNRWVVSQLHAVRRNGELACKCDVEPNRAEVYDLPGVYPVNRPLICLDSMSYLRIALAREVRKASDAR